MALTVFLAILPPFLYLREPVRQRAAADKELTESVRLGKATFEEFCSRRHGLGGQGDVVKRYVTPGVKGTDVPAPDLREIHSRHPDEDPGAVAWEAIQKGQPALAHADLGPATAG